MKSILELAMEITAPEAMAVIFEHAKSIALERRSDFRCGPGPYGEVYAVPLPSGAYATISVLAGMSAREMEELEEIVTLLAADFPVGGDAAVLWGLCVVEAMTDAAVSALSVPN